MTKNQHILNTSFLKRDFEAKIKGIASSMANSTDASSREIARFIAEKLGLKKQKKSDVIRYAKAVVEMTRGNNGGDMKPAFIKDKGYASYEPSFKDRD